MKRSLYDETNELFRKSFRQFVDREILPSFDRWEGIGRVDRSLYKRAGEAGFIGMAVPESFGGSGLDDFRYNAIVTEELCMAGVLGAGQGLVVHTNIFLPYLINLGTPEQMSRWLPTLCSGETLGAIAMTEPGTGSDLGAICTKATLDGDHYVISGRKQFITNGSSCDLVIVVCRTGPVDRRHQNLSLILVESASPGFSRGQPLRKIGQHSSDTAELAFDEVRVPKTNLLGTEGAGFRHLVAGLPQERLSIALAALWHAEAAFGWTLEYAKSRMAFGQPIGSFQNTRFAMATMRTELDIGRTYLDEQVLALAQGELTAEDAAAGKWWCSELNKRVLDGCLQIHGGYGYMEEYPIARAWRDGRSMSIYGGTTEVMKDIVGRRVLGI